jgi:excisionase family DNA binding protein
MQKTQLININQVCSMLAVSRGKIYRMIAAQEMPAPIKLGEKSIRWRLSTIEDFISQADEGRANEK